MSPELFKKAALLMKRVAPQSVEAAKRVLVDAEPAKEVHKDYGITYSRLIAIIHQFENKAQTIVDEYGLVVIEAAVTPEYAKAIRTEEKAILKVVK